MELSSGPWCAETGRNSGGATRLGAERDLVPALAGDSGRIMRPRMAFKLHPKKALEAILYVAPRVRSGDMYLTLKTLYVADKCHLERYGRFIFGDWYAAMEWGPVGSNAYDIVKVARGDNGATSVVQDIPTALNVKGNSIVVLREANMRLLSDSDLECLETAIKQYGAKSFVEARDASHDAAWRATSRNREMALEAIAATLPNGPELIQYFEERLGDD